MNRFSLFSIARKILAAAVFPENCVVCGAPGDGGPEGLPLCGRCFGKIQRPAPVNVRCGICGCQLISEKNLCMECRKRNPYAHLKRAYPLFSYQGWGRELLSAWKGGEKRSLSPLLAAILAEAAEEVFPGIPIVPVPPRPGKIREKGWDQVAELSALIEKRFRYPVLRLLRRTGAVQQKQLNREERLSNLKTAFRFCPPKRGSPVPDTALLLDDVITTGATLDACASVLAENGVAAVYGISLFYD
ncbi:MAG: ComF family protein [Spirochaetaceae bacterium]|jgi:ComF family protein|nr:ComF family protein [Spirochaetaceae bacterium]